MNALTAEQLLAIVPAAAKRIHLFLPHLNKYMADFGIDTPARAAAFLAQLAHESGGLQYVRELGSDAYLEKYDTGPIAERLGNTAADDGDGQKYRGRGLIQITGTENYRRCGAGLNLDLLSKPHLLEDPQYAVASACWFWASKGLNNLADQGKFITITKRINGGTNGLPERIMYHERAKKALGVV